MREEPWRGGMHSSSATKLRGFTRCASVCVDARGYDAAVEEDFERPPSHDRVLRAVARQARSLAGIARNTSREDERSPGATQDGERQAEAMASRLCAKISSQVLRILGWTLSLAWKRLYASEVYVEEGALHKLREAMKSGKSVVLLPTHQSHLDYMLLSYAMRAEAMPMPHIAAGDNLNLPWLGGVLRRGGAFFIPRVIKGRDDEQLVKAVLKAYVDVLVRNGAAVEFFAEGGRSRDGRIGKMRLGLLSLVAQAGNKENQIKQARIEADEENDRSRLERVPRDVVFVPVAIAYDSTLERATFAEEARGKKKEKESLFGFLKACFDVLMQRRGRVYVTFGRFATLEEFEEQAREKAPPSTASSSYEDSQLQHRLVVGSIGEYLARQLRGKLVITRTDIVAAVLMEKWSSGIQGGWVTWEELVAKSSWLAKQVSSRGATVSVEWDNMENCIKSAIELMQEILQIESEDVGGEVGGRYKVGNTPSMHLQIWQHVNHILPWLASRGIVACVLQSMAHGRNCDPREGVPCAGFSRSLADLIEILGEEIRPFLEMDRPREGLEKNGTKLRLPREYYTEEILQATLELEAEGELCFSADRNTVARSQVKHTDDSLSFAANLVKPLIRTFHVSFSSAKSLGDGPRSESELVELADERCLEELEWTSVMPSVSIIKSACKALLRLEVVSTQSGDYKREKALSRFDVKYGTELNLPKLEEVSSGNPTRRYSSGLASMGRTSSRKMLSLNGSSASQHGNSDSLDTLLKRTRSYIM